MTKAPDRLDRMIREARREADRRATGYRERALKLYPWVCGVCARTFTHNNLQLLEVHHKNGNHDDNPADGSNWELLCTYCHEHEHSKLKDLEGRVGGDAAPVPAVHSPFADLRTLLASKKPR